MEVFLYLQVLVKELVKEMIYIMKCRIQVLYLVQIYHHSIERIFFTQVHKSTQSTPILQAGSEVSTLLGRMPSAVGYQPTLCTEMGSIQERIVATKLGSITSIQAIFVPADDLTDPAPAIIFGHLDAITVLSRALAAKAIYPAVDPFNSTSKMLSPSHISEDCCRDIYKNSR